MACDWMQGTQGLLTKKCDKALGEWVVKQGAGQSTMPCLEHCCITPHTDAAASLGSTVPDNILHFSSIDN